MDPTTNGHAIGPRRSLVHDMLASGLSILPAARSEKVPALDGWKLYQSRLPEEVEVERWFPEHGRRTPCVCIVCGRVSGNVEMIDFDLAGEAFDAWCDLVRDAELGLLRRLVIERSPSGGRHAVYRCTEPVPGNLKLASRRVAVPGPEPIEIGGKPRVPRRGKDGAYTVSVTLIETRGEGGIFLCAPTPGYELLQGDLLRLPTITAEEREILIGCAKAVDEVREDLVDAPCSPAAADHWVLRPGDDFNARGDVGAILRRHGWTLARDGENQHWRRPGKSTGTSATFRDGCFYCFSTNAEPFEASRGYSRFAVMAMLEHAGDWTAAAATLASQGYGVAEDPTRGVDLSGLLEPSRAIVPAMSVGQLVDRFPKMRPPIIHGLLRAGESMNVVASPKAGKSWLVIDLAIAIASGRPWLGTFATESGSVLVIDNELHGETSADRIPKVAAARNVAMRAIRDRIYVDNIRGRLQSILSMESYFAAIGRGRFRLIVLDAFYRFMPPDSDENDNGTMAQVYNLIDSYADRLQAAFVLIHHTTKGSQSGKSVTDVGAGAGAQSRAADTHLVLRPHEEDRAVVLDAAVRSWPPIQPLCLRWEFPLWHRDDTLDPTALRTERANKRPKDGSEADTWDVGRFVETLISKTPITATQLRAEAGELPGLTARRAIQLAALAERRGLIARVRLPGRGGPEGFVLASAGGSTTNSTSRDA